MQFIKSTHKWVSLLVVIQLLIWLGSGLYFNQMDHHKAGGHTYRAHNSVVPSASEFVAVKQLPVTEKIKEVRVIYLLEKPYYLVTQKQPLYSNWQGQYRLFDAKTGKPFKIDKTTAKALAMSSYNGPGAVVSITPLDPPLADLPKERNSVWQVNFDDAINSSVYLRQQTGQIVGHVDDHRRLRDLLFMLHFMDYAEEGSFNNIQIIIFALFTLWLAMTGFIWTLNLIKEGQLSLPKGGRKAVSVNILDNDQQHELRLTSQHSLFSSLWEQDYCLPSSCGGGGTCGKCLVKAEKSVPIYSADKEQLTSEQLEQGWRLACQHKTAQFSYVDILSLEKALPNHRLKLVAERHLSPVIKELTFEPVTGEVQAYQAGAHMRFEIPSRSDDEANALRHYSLATPADDPGLVFNVRHHAAPDTTLPAGVGSDYLCKLIPGDEVVVQGPIESFSLKPQHDGPIIFLGAGSGMAPLRAMIQSLLSGNTKDPIYYYYGARTEDDLLYFDEFSVLQQQHENFHYYPVLSQPSQNWLGKTGYAQDLMFSMQAQIRGFSDAQFYLCGPQIMMQQCIGRLIETGIPSTAISWDAFGEEVVIASS